MLPLNNCFAFIGSLCFMFFVLSVWCDYRRCRLPVVLYVQAVCVFFVLSVWRDYRRCCLTVVLHVEPIEEGQSPPAAGGFALSMGTVYQKS